LQLLQKYALKAFTSITPMTIPSRGGTGRTWKINCVK